LARYSTENLGAQYESAESLSRAVKQGVSEQAAMCIVETLLQSPGEQKKSIYGVPATGLSVSQRALLSSTFAQTSAALQLSASIQQPIVALGAPVNAYYNECASCLHTTAVLPKHAAVANALGAVVGSIRQSVVYTLSPAGGKRVRVHDINGPEIFNTLEEAAEFAIQRASSTAQQHAEIAGAADVNITIERCDNVVEDQGATTFFGSEIVATAVGRPIQRTATVTD